MAVDLETEFLGMMTASFDDPQSLSAVQVDGMRAAFFGGAIVVLRELPDDLPAKLHFMLQLQAFIRDHNARHGLKPKGGTHG